QREFLLEPRRGDILDVRGTVLATTVPTKKVCADPVAMLGHAPEVAHLLAPLLGIAEPALAQNLALSTHRNDKGEVVTNRYVCLKRRVPIEVWSKIQSAMTNLCPEIDQKKLSAAEKNYYRGLRFRSIFAEADQLRVYPNKTLASHVLGFVTAEDQEVDDFKVNETVGREGIEKTLNAQLQGIRGWRLTELDHRARELVNFREQDVEPQDGLNVVLTLDSGLQTIVESELASAMEKHTPISISGIVIRPRTGEVLALATLPEFDPNKPGDYSPDARRNRVITDVAEPGSTFKIVVVSGALNDGTVTLDENFDCEHGHWFFAGRTLHDHEAYGSLSVEGIITKSSNIGAGKVGVKMGENRLYDYISNYGFGTRTGIPLPGEVPGLVRPLKKWSKVSIAQIPMGQGIAVTRLQMLMAMCAIANNGVLMRPMLVDRLEDSEHNVVAKYSPQRVRRVISETAAKQMVEALKTVVAPDGTAPKAVLEHYTVAGKTGTAWKVENGAYVRKYFSSFIGFFPADNPELCISITMDEPKQGYYGGQIAAPVFKAIAERAANYLNIRPEDNGANPGPDNLVTPGDVRSLKTAAAP
ncbi:MAG TPA: penicillin-binding protein 2, partial [Verrucomicrobiae bacterium]|nr:penicillin-binding protein 2 [Verrucomicrobiae bacterium]